MTTTIQVSEVTQQLLKKAKMLMDKRSYDAVIQELIIQQQQIPSSLAGRFPELARRLHPTA